MPGDVRIDGLNGAGRGLYRALPGLPDEMVDAEGAIRPLWRRLAGHIGALDAEALTRDLARADRYLLDSGVFFRQYGAGQSTERTWPLSHIPVLLSEADWAQISAALIQRADLLESVMADLYGPNDLVASGRLPAQLVAGNREWLRPMVGVRPRSGHYLHFLAFELGRGPRGNWWVLADRAQAPSGAGYALENRVATARALGEVYGQENVHRLAGFFRDFRDALLAQAGRGGGRVAILSPGPMNETYFEHAYIARYLGITLVEGGDLAVAGDRLTVRTVSGMRPVEVLWRRLDSSYADPLELDPASRIGTPGMVATLRAGQVTMVNQIGSGVLETRALMAFLPKLARDLTGTPLAMPNIATWWCGDASARAAVLDAPDRMFLSDALATAMPFDRNADQVRASDLAPRALAARLAARGSDLVAQEAVTLSTTPALVEGRLVPRPMSMRVYLARTEQGWTAMPGGFARIGGRHRGHPSIEIVTQAQLRREVVGGGEVRRIERRAHERGARAAAAGIGIVSAVTEMGPGDAPPRRPRAALPAEVRLRLSSLLSPHRPCRRGQVRRLRRGGGRGRAARRRARHAGRVLLAARRVAAEGGAERLDLF